MATYSPFLDAKARLKLDGALLEADLAILDELSLALIGNASGQTAGGSGI
jgi:hypothetical protein